jgi:hypothetical protein
MKSDRSVAKPNFDHLFEVMTQHKEVEEKAVRYLHEENRIDKSLIYNELLSKKRVGYSPERKALAFPLVRGFLIVGIQYLALESFEENGTRIEVGHEYCHEESDLKTGVFTLQMNYREAIITSGILDLLSTGLGGVSVPNLTEFAQLQLFSDMHTTVCLKNSEEAEMAARKVLKALPKATIITLPKAYRSLHHLLMERGQSAVNALLKEGKRTGKTKGSPAPKVDKGFKVSTCRYFGTPGLKHTQATLDAAHERVKTLGIEKIVISSWTGNTALKARETFGKGLSLVMVTHESGFNNSAHQHLQEKQKKMLLEKGISVLTTTHAFESRGSTFGSQTGSPQIDEHTTHALQIFGQGTKVAVEIALMAADAGLVGTDEDIISIGGTASGVDTALVIKPAPTQKFFDFKVREIICKPSDF